MKTIALQWDHEKHFPNLESDISSLIYFSSQRCGDENPIRLPGYSSNSNGHILKQALLIAEVLTFLKASLLTNCRSILFFFSFFLRIISLAVSVF